MSDELRICGNGHVEICYHPDRSLYGMRRGRDECPLCYGLALAKAVIEHADFPPMQGNWQVIVFQAGDLIEKAGEK